VGVGSQESEAWEGREEGEGAEVKVEVEVEH
jgi:hypothetical protein